MLVIPASLSTQATDARSHAHAHCWRITPRRDPSKVLRFTDYPHEIQVRESTGPELYTYTPTDGLDASARRRADELEASDKELKGIISSSAITTADLRGGLYDGAQVDEFLVDFRQAWSGYIDHARYFIRSVKYDRGMWDAEVAGITAFLDAPAGQVWTPRCRVDLFSTACGLDENDYLMEGSASVWDADTLYLIFALDDTSGDWGTDGHADDGVIKWITGANKGLVTHIKSYNYQSPGVADVVFSHPPAYEITSGDAFVILPGCNKIAVGTQTGSVYSGHCKEKFNNVVNFQGEPLIPGRDKVFDGVTYPGD